MICYPDSTDWSCYGSEADVDAIDDVLKARSEALAWSSLWTLTGGAISICPITVRPCKRDCVRGTWYESYELASGASTGGPFTPTMTANGAWVNTCACQTNICSCGEVCEVLLPGPVGKIVEIKIDGEVVDPATYRVDNFNLLTRTNDECWPTCQDMSKEDTEEGTFSVTYYRGEAPNSLTNYAAGLLAAEYLKACQGKKCRLPAGVTSIVRQGVSMEIATGAFPGGYSGIREVDTVVAAINPYGLRQPSSVKSPDTQRSRMTTVRGY
jgi:hypothetical protein